MDLGTPAYMEFVNMLKEFLLPGTKAIIHHNQIGIIGAGVDIVSALAKSLPNYEIIVLDKIRPNKQYFAESGKNDFLKNMPSVKDFEFTLTPYVTKAAIAVRNSETNLIAGKRQRYIPAATGGGKGYIPKQGLPGIRKPKKKKR